MYRICNLLILGIALFFVSTVSLGQSNEYNYPEFDFSKGIGIKSPDESFYVNFGFRFQPRISYTSADLELFDFGNIEARIRRMRLKFNGYIFDPKVAFKLELGFENTSITFENATVPNIILDAVMFYKPNKNWSFLFGQTKLPGNRQRVISSGNLELVDRTTANSRFNIDRDMGVQAHYTNSINDVVYAVKGAVSSGEGRNFISTDDGLAYTARVELLPLGKFKNKGDYSEGDLEREEKPKLSIGATASTNRNAVRERGQTGRLLYEPRDMNSYFVDMIFKYNGWAFMAEYLSRTTDDPITTNDEGNIRYVWAGHGSFLKGSYVFKSNWLIGSSITWLKPTEEIVVYTSELTEYTIGVTKFIKGHRLKVQSDISYQDRPQISSNQIIFDNWQIRFQVEIGI